MKTIIKKILEQTNLNEQEAWWMLEHITKKNKTTLLYNLNQSLSEQELQTIATWIQKISQESIPLSYLLGSVPFCNITIRVHPPILIPRQETEEWVNSLIETIKPYQKSIQNILDIGTGSGCLGIALAKAFPNAIITATDINPIALQLAQENAQINNVSNIKFLTSNIFSNIDEKFDLIVSNPPYIATKFTQNMIPQVLLWEDHQALFADDDGLFILKKIIEQASKYIMIQPELPFQLILEHDTTQYQQIQTMAEKNNITCESKKDLFGNWRTTWCKFIN